MTYRWRIFEDVWGFRNVIKPKSMKNGKEREGGQLEREQIKTFFDPLPPPSSCACKYLVIEWPLNWIGI